MNTIYKVDWTIGEHISFLGGIKPTLYQAITKGMYCMQIFMGSPRSYKRNYIFDEDIEDCKKLLERFPTHIFSHFPYIANLAGKSNKNGLAWDGDSTIDNSVYIMLNGLEYELDVISRIGKGVVIHPGSFPDRDLGHKAVAKTINKIKFTENGMLLLENCAGEGNKLCRDFTEIQFVLSHLTESQVKHVGVCVDTAHIWGCGDYDLREPEEVCRMFTDFDNIIGLNKFKLLHLNDSKVFMGSKKDRHADIGVGEIWKDDYSSLLVLLDLCESNEIPVILETGGPCMKTISQLRK
jgi:apurinic endonuclease APN1|uniref:Xylose isomerase-like TIM barrel domain-containing protein n=1 Tax=viral metagenome TaxID=1070528 RepID=A0A6C0LVN2_9ZZZZ